MIRSSYEQRQQTMDRISHQFSQYPWVNEYYDPAKGYGVELPGGYRYAWRNSLGDIVTHEAGYNPNIGSNRTGRDG